VAGGGAVLVLLLPWLESRWCPATTFYWQQFAAAAASSLTG